MKPFYLLWTVICISKSLSAQVPTKHALIIAISDYNQAVTRWGKLSSANDIGLIQTALQKQEFKTENITVVQNTNANGIINAFLQLKNKIKSGDIVVVHYSGHGVQLQDDNGDEPDRLDEALVPLEAIYEVEALKSNSYLRDDTLGEWIFQLRQKLGTNGHLLLMLDSCHSGSGTRGNALVRGGMAPLVQPNFKITTAIPTSSQSIVDEPVASRGQGNEGLSKFVLFAGASSNESNFETYANGRPVGSLSFVFSKVVSQLKPDDTYRQVFARMRAEMAVVASRQNPVLEGDVDYRFFSGQLIKQEPYFELQKIVDIDANSYQLNGGVITGVNKGDRFKLFPAGTASIQNGTSVLEGEVVAVDDFTSTIQFKNPMPMGFKLAQFWAFRTQQSFSDSQIKVALQLKALSPTLVKKMTDSLQQWPFVKVVLAPEQPDLLLKNSPNTSLITANVADVDLPYLDMTPIECSTLEGIASLKKVLLSYAQTKFLKSVKLSSEEINVALSLVRVKAKVENGGFKVLQKYATTIDTLTRRFDENDQMLIQLINKGKQKAYFTIVTIQPDDKIIPIVLNDTDGNSYSISAGDTLLLNTLLNGFSPPYGAEMIKVFATPKPINLWPIIESQGAIVTKRGKEDENALESFLGDFYSNSRGPRPVQAKQDMGSTFEYVYTIVPAKK